MTTIVSMIVAIVFYGVGYYGGYGLIQKLQKKYRNANKRIAKYKHLFSKYNKRALFIARCIPFSRTYVSLFAGACRQNFYSYVFFSFFGIFLWNALLVWLGFSIYTGFLYKINVISLF